VRALPLVSDRAPFSAPPRSVRISLTDRCDLACIYCRPHKKDGYTETPLDLASWKAMLRSLVDSGIRRVRITGGEPLLFGQLIHVVEFLASLPLDDIALTTNGTRLQKLAAPLRAAGLQRLNISIDSLDRERFHRMTRGGDLDQVQRGIDAAIAAGFSSIKLNTVVVREENDHEIESITQWAWSKEMVPRFLEVMAVGEGAHLHDRVVTGREMLERLSSLVVDEPLTGEVDRGPARYVRARHNHALRVGFITGTSDTYCSGCDRLRVSSEGVLRPCLATNDGVAAAASAARGDSLALSADLARAWEMKPNGDTWKGCTEPTAREVSIRAIGG